MNREEHNMKITDSIYLVGSGQAGCMISNVSDCHVYLVESTAGLILIDAGVGLETERIVANIEKDNLDPNGIAHLFLTHSHADHAGGAKNLKDRFGCSVHVSQAEAHLLRESDLMDQGLDIAIVDGIYPADYRFTNCDPDVEVSDGDTFTIGEWTIRAYHTPGHSTGSICYLFTTGERRLLFSGDVVVHGGKLMFLNCEGSVMADMRASMPKLGGLNIGELYPGHGCWVCARGQEHIDKAIEALRHLGPPPNAF